MKKDFLSPIGFGALMGLLKNYEVINPFISSSNDSMNRLKPGYEAPVCIVTSLGRSVNMPSRNRTVLVGLVRDLNNPLATRFELRAPNPKSNTYLVLATAYVAIIDGVRAVLSGEKTSADLERSLSKKYGEEDFYLDTDRRTCVKLHDVKDFNDVDVQNWLEIERLKRALGQNTLEQECLLTQIKRALDDERYDDASDLQLEIKDRKEELMNRYSEYQKNLLI